MRVLILGGSGMLGHKLWQVLGRRFDTYVTFRQSTDTYSRYGLFELSRCIERVAAEDFESVVQAVDSVRPTVIVNCIGIVKQAEAAIDPVVSITVNSLFPNLVARLCLSRKVRLIHISTDCVFAGRKGAYLEEDVADADDLYGRTKLLGEVSEEGCLTLRTSMIGRELDTSHGLIEWFLDQRGRTVSGYRRAVFSGFTTIALANVIDNIIGLWPGLQGLYHVASEPISKFDLLSMVRDTHKLDINVEPDQSVVVDRSLNGHRFRQATGFVAPPWPDMIRQMYDDPTPYAELRRQHVKR